MTESETVLPPLPSTLTDEQKEAIVQLVLDYGYKCSAYPWSVARCHKKPVAFGYIIRKAPHAVLMCEKHLPIFKNEMKKIVML